MKNLNEKEIAAIKKVYEILGFTDPDVESDYNNGVITINTINQLKRPVAHYMDEANECAVYVDTLEELSKEELEKLF